MNEIQIFNNKEFGSIRTVNIDGEPWFVGKDVANALGYSNNRKAISDHVGEEDKRDGVTIRDSIGREQNPILINESGLYSLIFGSKLESAKRFKHWVTSEVLPTIRKTGSYQSVPQGKELLALAVLEAQKTIEEQNHKIKEMQPKAIFADAVSASETSILVGDLAKLICQNGYLMKCGSSRNMPTQRYLEQGLFEVKESNVQNPDGSIRITRTTKITGCGQLYFVNKFLGRKEE